MITITTLNVFDVVLFSFDEDDPKVLEEQGNS
jgi:hypothetical protein